VKYIHTRNMRHSPTWGRPWP